MLSREDLRQIMHLLIPIKTRIANACARAVVQVIDDDMKLQIVQLGVLEGEDLDDCENFQGFGFKSVPLPGAEAVAVFPNSDRGVPLVVATEDRRHRPTGWAGGETGTYNAFSAIMHHRVDGTTEITGGGAALPLATKADLDALIASFNAHVTLYSGHVHPGVTAGPASTAITVPGVAASASVGTLKLKGE